MKTLSIALIALAGCITTPPFSPPDGGAGPDASVEPTLRFEPRWIRAMGGPGEDIARACAIDSDGNVYVVGHYAEGSAFEGFADPGTGGLVDAFLARYQSDGTPSQLLTFGGPNTETFEDIAAVGDGVYVVGQYNGAVDFGGGPLAAVAGQESVIARFNRSDLSHAWSAAGTGTGASRATGVSVDDNVAYVTGYFGNNGTGGTHALGGACSEQVADNSRDGFVAALDANGDCLWGQPIASAGGDTANRISVVSQQATQIYVGGEYNGLPTEAPVSHDFFVAQFAENSGVERNFYSARNPDAFSATYDVVGISNRVCAVGRFNGIVDFAPDDQREAVNAPDAFITCRIADAHDWTQTIGNEDGGVRFDAVAARGSLAIAAGSFNSSIDTGVGLAEGNSIETMLVAYASADGRPTALYVGAGDGPERAEGIAVRDNAVCVVGNFEQTIVHGDETRTATLESTDAYLAVFDIVEQ